MLTQYVYAQSELDATLQVLDGEGEANIAFAKIPACYRTDLARGLCKMFKVTVEAKLVEKGGK
jgi:hypothetical protein